MISDAVALAGVALYRLLPVNGTIPGAPILPTKSMVLSEGQMCLGWQRHSATHRRGQRNVRSNGVTVRYCDYCVVDIVVTLVFFLSIESHRSYPLCYC